MNLQKHGSFKKNLEGKFFRYLNCQLKCKRLKIAYLFFHNFAENLYLGAAVSNYNWMNYMYFEERKKNEITILDCFGRFDDADTNQFIKKLEQLQNQGIQHLILNLSPVYYLDPKVVNLIFFGQQFILAHSGTFSVISPLSSVRNELVRGKIPDTIPTFDTLYDAMHRPHSAYQECSN